MRAPVFCNFVDQHAVRYFFTAREAGVPAGVESHLIGCLRCRRKLQVFARVWRWDGQRRARKPLARQDGLSVSDDVATISRLST
jgi:hypothetical protein